MSDLCPVCGKTLKNGSINHDGMIFYIHYEVPTDSFFNIFNKGLIIATHTYRCCSLVKNTGEKSRGYFCIYLEDPAEEQGDERDWPGVWR